MEMCDDGESSDGQQLGAQRARQSMSVCSSGLALQGLVKWEGSIVSMSMKDRQVKCNRVEWKGWPPRARTRGRRRGRREA